MVNCMHRDSADKKGIGKLCPIDKFFITLSVWSIEACRLEK